MINYLTNTNELTDVADAIREKGGTSAPLTYPTGFVSAIQNISTSGGGGVETVTVSIASEYGMIAYAINNEPDGYMADSTQQIDACVGSYLTVFAFGVSLTSEEGDVFTDCILWDASGQYIYVIPVLDHDMTLIAS